MISAARIASDFRLDANRAFQDLNQGLAEGHIKPDEFSLRDLATHLTLVNGQPLGYEGMRLLEHRSDQVRLLESSGAVSTSAFRLVTHRIVDAAVIEGSRLPDTVVTPAIPVVSGRKRINEMPSPTLPLAEGKRISDIQETEEYPVVSIYGQRVRTLPARKKGFQIPITREAVLEDDTGALLDAARQCGSIIAREIEHLILDFITGAIPNCVNERRSGDQSDQISNLFLDSGRWANSAVNPLVDWNDIDDSEAQLTLNTMPDTDGNAVLLRRVMLVTEQRMSNAWRVMNSIETRSGSGNITVAGNPLQQKNITLLAAPHLRARHAAAGLNADQSLGRWYYGDLAQAFRYYQLWPTETREDPQPADGVTRDIWMRFQVSEMGVPVCIQPRVWGRNLPA
jgi:hypothetical protein